MQMNMYVDPILDSFQKKLLRHLDLYDLKLLFHALHKSLNLCAWLPNLHKQKNGPLFQQGDVCCTRPCLLLF